MDTSNKSPCRKIVAFLVQYVIFRPSCRRKLRGAARRRPPPSRRGRVGDTGVMRADRFEIDADRFESFKGSQDSNLGMAESKSGWFA
jgi:hypothetical protein